MIPLLVILFAICVLISAYVPIIYWVGVGIVYAIRKSSSAKIDSEKKSHEQRKKELHNEISSMKQKKREMEKTGSLSREEQQEYDKQIDFQESVLAAEFRRHFDEDEKHSVPNELLSWSLAILIPAGIIGTLINILP